MIGQSQRSLPIVGVMGSGTDADVPRCAELGRWLASIDVHLLTGGGGGVMAAVSQAFHEVEERRGLVIGVLRAAARGSSEQRAGYPNPWVELAIRTHLPLSGGEGADIASRNHINVLTADVVIALPGARGTHSEVELALRYRRPLIAYLRDRSEIPDLSNAVVVTAELDEVKSFVRRTVGTSP